MCKTVLRIFILAVFVTLIRNSTGYAASSDVD